MSLMALRVLLPKQRGAIPMGGSGSQAGAVGICGIAGCIAFTAVPWVAAAAAVAPTRVLRSYTSSAVMRPIHKRLSRAVNKGSAPWCWVASNSNK